jgi:hypothetical protein
MCNSLQAHEIPVLDAAKPKPHCNNKKKTLLLPPLLQQQQQQKAAQALTPLPRGRKGRPWNPAPAGQGTDPVTRRIPDRISCKEMKKMSGFPTSLERALLLTSCNLIDGGFVPVLGRYPVWRVRKWQVLDPGNQNQTGTRSDFWNWVWTRIRGFIFFKELEPKLGTRILVL